MSNYILNESHILKQYIRNKVQQLIEESDDISDDNIETLGVDIKTGFGELEKIKDDILKKIDELQASRKSALDYYKKVKSIPEKVGGAVQDLKDINDKISKWTKKLDKLEEQFSDSITTVANALDSKIVISKAKDKIKKDQEEEMDDTDLF